ncbi:unnamed protein product [Coffea canephora]|uniref:Uncharacterized protein n=1 Tax=Coffea canephora TaxID=49390 RepID=A0A068VEP2_COFCA|nr:unnamed protein product [Coffea canephora]
MMRIQQTSIAQFTLDLEGLKEANKIMALPGQPKRVNFDLYSGYVTVDPKISGADPWADDYALSYLNNPDVQKSLHATTTGTSGPSSLCSNSINWTDSPDHVLPTIKELMASGINLWIYRGICEKENHFSSLVHPRRGWRICGGISELTFVTVRGAGLLVPRYQPARALGVFSSFMEGKLPSSS